MRFEGIVQASFGLLDQLSAFVNLAIDLFQLSPSLIELIAGRGDVARELAALMLPGLSLFPASMQNLLGRHPFAVCGCNA